MPSTTNLLIVSTDERLVAELDAAVRPLDDARPVMYHVHDVRQAIDVARSRQPQWTFLEMGSDLRDLARVVDEIGAAAPETSFVAVFHPEGFGPDVSESALFVEAVRTGVSDFLRRPVSSSELADILNRHARPARRAAVPTGSIVSFISNKGGTGKSTLAVNVACGLAMRNPGRVLLVDASLQMGVCASMLDVTPTATLSDAAREQDRLDETLIRQFATPHESGLHLLAAPTDSLESANIDDEHLSRVLTLARRAYDYVFVDTFPMFDRVNVAVLDLSDRAYLVFENVVPTLRGAVQLLRMLNTLGFPQERQKIILNRHTSLPGSLDMDVVAERLGQEIDHVIPFDEKVVVAANLGVPYVTQRFRFRTSLKRIRGIVDEIEAMPRGASVPSNGQVRADIIPENAGPRPTTSEEDL